jgi:hypothetical protein
MHDRLAYIFNDDDDTSGRRLRKARPRESRTTFVLCGATGHIYFSTHLPKVLKMLQAKLLRLVRATSGLNHTVRLYLLRGSF